MIWKLKLLAEAKKSLDKLNPAIVKQILIRFRQRVLDQENPVTYAKPLSGPFAGYFRLRIEDYRVIFRVLTETTENHESKVVEITHIGHRKNVYKES